MKRLLTVFILAVMLCAMAAGAAAQEGIPYTVSYYVPTLRPVIDRSSPVRVIDTRGSGATPFNGSKLPSIGLGLEKDDQDNQDNYRVKSENGTTKVFKDQTCYYPAQPGLSYINEISGVFLESETYLLSRVVIKDDLGKVVSEFEDENTIRSIVFTNNQQASIDGRTVIIRENGSTHIELHYTAKENAFRVPADFYDYDISDGEIYDSNWNVITNRNADTIYANTTEQGINSPDEDEWKGGGAKLAFGNQNTSSGLHDQTWNGQTFNVYNSNNPGEHSGTTYGITVNNALRTDADGKKLPVFQQDIAYKEWFGPEAATGKTQIDDFELGFFNVGDTYTLKWVYKGDEAVISNLDSFRKRDFYDSDGEYDKSIYSNDFWPMDHAGTYNQDGHDIKFGDQDNYENEKRMRGKKDDETVKPLPPGDDGLDHNSYFGMRFSLQFELDPDYMGPMEYVFFGDDDMWVYLEKPDGTIVQIIDIGGVHSSVGQIADLWDYIYPGKPESEAAGESCAGVYKLHFFYTERGASGSTCFMQFTLPSVSVIYENQYRDLIVSKEVAHETDTESAFEFEITIDDINRVRGDKIAYTIHDASGNVVRLPDPLNPDEDPTIQDSVAKRIKLKDDWYVRFKMISIGSAYQIQEIDPGTGFATEYQTFEFTDASLRRSAGYVASNLSSAAAGRDTGSRTIGNGSVDGYGVRFINHPLYKLEIRKDADYPQPDEMFSFKVELKDANGQAFPDAVKVRYRSDSADWTQSPANLPIDGFVADGGVFTIDGLPYGAKYTITETASSGTHGLPGYETTYQVDDGSVQSGTATGMLTVNGDVSVLFENKAKLANLVIHKEATDEIPGEKFDIEVAITGESRSDYSALTYDVRGADGQPVSGKDNVEVALSDGVAAPIQESITEDQYIVIEGIPYGSSYTVKETGDGLHRFVVSAAGKNRETVSDDGKTVTGTISASADYTVTFKNVNRQAGLELTKKTKDFGKGEFELLDAVFSLEHNAQVCCAADFEAPAYTGGSGESAKHVFEKVRVGHQYLLRETRSPVHHLIPKEGWTITVEATEDGRFTLRGVDEKGKTLAFDTLDIAFGVYNEILYMPTHAEFEVGKLLDNLNPQDSDVFTFTLTQVKADYISTSGGDTIIDRAALDDPQWSMEASNVTTNASGNTVTGSKVVFSDGEHLRFEQKDMYVEGSDIYTSEFFYLIREKATDQKVTIDETIYGVRLRMLPDTQKANGQSETAIPLVQDEVYFVLGEDGKVAYLNGGLVPTYKNTSRVDIRLLKFDPGDVRLTGAEFELVHDADCEDCSGANIPAIASVERAGGQYVMTDLLVGHDYLLTETKAPDYHLRPREPWKLRVKATGYQQFGLSIVGEAGNLRINQATATGENPTFEIEVHDPQRYPAITLKLGAKKLLDDLIPPQGKQYTFNLYAADEKPVQSESFDLGRYVGRAKLLERAKNVRGDIDFSTALRYTHHDIHADHGGKEFYFLINETWPDEKGLVHDTSVFLITVRIHAAGGDAFTAGSLVPEIECHRIYPDGSMSRESAAAVQSMYENVSGKALGVPTAVFRNNRMGDLPETGDESRMALYAVLLAVSVGALLALGFMRRRKQ